VQAQRVGDSRLPWFEAVPCALLLVKLKRLVPRGEGDRQARSSCCSVAEKNPKVGMCPYTEKKMSIARTQSLT